MDPEGTATWAVSLRRSIWIFGGRKQEKRLGGHTNGETVTFQHFFGCGVLSSLYRLIKKIIIYMYGSTHTHKQIRTTSHKSRDVVCRIGNQPGKSPTHRWSTPNYAPGFPEISTSSLKIGQTPTETDHLTTIHFQVWAVSFRNSTSLTIKTQSSMGGNLPNNGCFRLHH